MRLIDNRQKMTIFAPCFARDTTLFAQLSVNELAPRPRRFDEQTNNRRSVRLNSAGLFHSIIEAVLGLFTEMGGSALSSCPIVSAATMIEDELKTF